MLIGINLNAESYEGILIRDEKNNMLDKFEDIHS